MIRNFILKSIDNKIMETICIKKECIIFKFFFFFITPASLYHSKMFSFFRAEKIKKSAFSILYKDVLEYIAQHKFLFT